jgi:aspartate ammonia-lyase
VTVLTEKIGYEEAAELVKEARRTRKPVAELAVKKGLITPAEATRYFDPVELSRDRQEP